MPTNNKSIHILRGRTSSTSEPNAVDNTPLEAGQPFYDKRTNTLRIGNGTSKIKDTNPVTVADGAITTNKLHSASNDTRNPTGITTAKIEDKNITTAKIADGAVTTTKLHDASNDESNRTGITTAKIENSAITGLKIANGSISDSKVASDADINGSKFKDNSISGSKLADASNDESNRTGITTDKIEDGSITGDKLAKKFVFEQLGGECTFTLSDGQFSEPTLEFADLHPSSNARVFLLADLEGKKDYQARLMLPTIADTEENTLATKEQIESGDIVAKTAQNATNATNAEKTDFSNAEWISVASGNTATFVNGGTYQITNPTVANAKTYISNIIYVPKHIETEIKFILGEYPSLTNDKQFWGVTEYHLILDTNFQAHVIRKSKPAGHDPYTDDLAFEYRRIR